MAKYRFYVEIDTKDPVLKTVLKEYVQEAVENWGGQFHPDDALFPSNLKLVTVYTIVGNGYKNE